MSPQLQFDLIQACAMFLGCLFKVPILKANKAIHEFCPFYTSSIPFYLSPANNKHDISPFHLFCGTNSSGVKAWVHFSRARTEIVRTHAAYGFAVSVNMNTSFGHVSVTVSYLCLVATL